MSRVSNVYDPFIGVKFDGKNLKESFTIPTDVDEVVGEV